jgi:hypothetical protein
MLGLDWPIEVLLEEMSVHALKRLPEKYSQAFATDGLLVWSEKQASNLKPAKFRRAPRT